MLACKCGTHRHGAALNPGLGVRAVSRVPWKSSPGHGDLIQPLLEGQSHPVPLMAPALCGSSIMCIRLQMELRLNTALNAPANTSGKNIRAFTTKLTPHFCQYGPVCIPLQPGLCKCLPSAQAVLEFLTSGINAHFCCQAQNGAEGFPQCSA